MKVGYEVVVGAGWSVRGREMRDAKTFRRPWLSWGLVGGMRGRALLDIINCSMMVAVCRQCVCEWFMARS